MEIPVEFYERGCRMSVILGAVIAGAHPCPVLIELLPAHAVALTNRCNLSLIFGNYLNS
jgi:hypothetical protein